MTLELLTNSARIELARLHGSTEKAQSCRKKNHWAPKPGDGQGVERRIIVLNDLHMAVGADMETNKFHPSDEFTAEHSRQFSAYLHREWRDAEEKNYELNLCLNGDIIDILQTAFERPGLHFPDGFSDDGLAPLNTPANVLVQLNIIYEGHRDFFHLIAQHLLKGHHIDYLPGNHDRHLYNDFVWCGKLALEERTIGGFTHIIEDELKLLTNDNAAIEMALGRLIRRPFSVYGDVYVDHGDSTDAFNRVSRPLQEMYQPSALHEPMELAFGDHGVRNGFNHLEILEPRLSSAPYYSLDFWGRAFKHPFKALKLIAGFFDASKQGGHEHSPYRDFTRRIADVRALVATYPDIERSINSLRPPEKQLTSEQIQDALEAIERASALPLLSNFTRTSGFLGRLYHTIFKGDDRRSEHRVVLDTLAAAHKWLGVNTAMHGHTHIARDDVYLTEEENSVRHVDTHTWMDRHGNWGRGVHTFGEKGRGVGVIELGHTTTGAVFSHVALNKIVGDSGELVAGDLFAEPDNDPLYTQTRMREIYRNNHVLDTVSDHVELSNTPANLILEYV